ncbi:MAG: hypothetical protein QHH19_01185 [Candidatus Thermoplasmatota archaeon]|jgi:hypothetical protein|nr:hypothetical protein [Candidatus Thermoplasmatota archaeon]
MNQLPKAQLTIALLACFTTVGMFQRVLTATDQFSAILNLIAQIVAIIILSIVILGLLEWVKIFDLKTNAVLTLIVVIAIRLTYVIVIK